MCQQDELSHAIVRWTGWRTALSPIRDDQLIANSSLGQGAILLDEVQSLEMDFYRSTTYLTALDLATMGAQAASEFRQRPPVISDEAVAALSWCYTYHPHHGDAGTGCAR